MQQQVRVHYGLNEIITVTLLEEVRDGILKGWVKLLMPDGHECFMSSKSIVTESNDTDWRTFLKFHWDATHNHCQVEHLNEFYAILRRAAAAYINKQNHEQEKSHHQHGAHEPRRADALLHPSGRQRPAAAMPARDKAKVRETNRQMKPVELSLSLIYKS